MLLFWDSTVWSYILVLLWHLFSWGNAMTLEVAAFFRAGYANLISMTLKFECFSKFGHSQQIGGWKKQKNELATRAQLSAIRAQFSTTGCNFKFLTNWSNIRQIYVHFSKNMANIRSYTEHKEFEIALEVENWGVSHWKLSIQLNDRLALRPLYYMISMCRIVLAQRLNMFSHPTHSGESLVAGASILNTNCVGDQMEMDLDAMMAVY